MIEVIGKTIGELPQASTLNDSFMFLGCQGTNTTYSTLKTTFGALKRDLSAEFMRSLAPDIENRLKAVEDAVTASDDSVFFKKNASVLQEVTAPAVFEDTVRFDSSVQFRRSGNVDSYAVVLPKDSFRDPSGNASANFAQNDANRIAVCKDISAAVQNLHTQLSPAFEQILDMSYSAYSSSIKIQPTVSNNNYQYDPSSDSPNVFYRYAGIRMPPPEEPSQSYALAAGAIYGKRSGFNGIPLTKSYRIFRYLTVVCLRDASPTTGAGSPQKLHSVTIPTFDIDLARQYISYKKQFSHVDKPKTYFDGVEDKWYFGDTTDSMLYMSIDVQDVFTDKFLPLQFSSSGYSVIAVFGQTTQGELG